MRHHFTSNVPISKTFENLLSYLSYHDRVWVIYAQEPSPFINLFDKRRPVQLFPFCGIGTHDARKNTLNLWIPQHTSALPALCTTANKNHVRVLIAICRREKSCKRHSLKFADIHWFRRAEFPIQNYLWQANLLLRDAFVLHWLAFIKPEADQFCGLHAAFCCGMYVNLREKADRPCLISRVLCTVLMPQSLHM